MDTIKQTVNYPAQLVVVKQLHYIMNLC